MYKLFLFVCALNLAFLAEAQPVSSYFVAMPDELLRLLETNRRKDLVDFARLERSDKVPNALGGTSEIVKMSDDYLMVQLTSQSTLQLKMLPVSDTVSVIAVINTVCAGACDSRIDFYDMQWKRLDRNEYFTSLKSADFMDTPSPATSPAYEEAEGLIDIDLITYRFEPGKNELTAELTIDDYMPEDIYKQVKPYLKELPLVFEWDGGQLNLKE